MRSTIDWDSFANFAEHEFACRCCGRADMDAVFLSKLQAIRDSCDFPMPVTSGFRCPDHNARVSSTGRGGPHTTGHAADIAVDGPGAVRVIRYALALGITGIGVQQKGSGRFLHLDDLVNGPGCYRPTIWSY